MCVWVRRPTRVHVCVFVCMCVRACVCVCVVCVCVETGELNVWLTGQREGSRRRQVLIRNKMPVMTSLFPHIPTDVMWRSVPLRDAGDSYKHTHTYIHTHTYKHTNPNTQIYTCLRLHSCRIKHTSSEMKEPFIQAGQMCSFRVQPPWSPNIQKGIVVWGKWFAHSKLELCVWERREGDRGIWGGKVERPLNAINNKGAQCWKITTSVFIILLQIHPS